MFANQSAVHPPPPPPRAVMNKNDAYGQQLTPGGETEGGDQSQDTSNLYYEVGNPIIKDMGIFD